MSNFTSQQSQACHFIIHASSISAGAVGAGLAQLPCADNVVITPIQLTMTVALGRVFNIELTDSAARASLASCAATVLRRKRISGFWVYKRMLASAPLMRTTITEPPTCTTECVFLRLSPKASGSGDGQWPPFRHLLQSEKNPPRCAKKQLQSSERVV